MRCSILLGDSGSDCWFSGEAKCEHFVTQLNWEELKEKERGGRSMEKATDTKMKAEVAK